jgi:hypothetical protein
MPWNCACPTKLPPILAARNQGDDFAGRALAPVSNSASNGYYSFPVPITPNVFYPRTGGRGMSRSSNGTSSPGQGIEIPFFFFCFDRPNHQGLFVAARKHGADEAFFPATPRAHNGDHSADRRCQALAGGRQVPDWTTRKRPTQTLVAVPRSGVSLRWRGGALSAAVQRLYTATWARDTSSRP